MKLLTPLLVASTVFAQDVVVEEEIVFDATSPEIVSCPPRYTPMDCTTESLVPKVYHSTCTSEIRGEGYVWVEDEAGNPREIIVPDKLKYYVTLEKWTDRRNEHVIDVHFKLTIKRYDTGWGQYNFVTRLDMCPFPETHVQGNVFWDWKNAYDWYGENATVEEWQKYEDAAILGGMDWRTRGSFGSGGDLYFGCRKIRGKMYDGPTPSFTNEEIEWNGHTWKSRFPETYPANIKLQPPCEYSYEEPDSNEFAINLSISMSGARGINMYSEEGGLNPRNEWEYVPNVVEIESWAQFVIMDPVECPTIYEEDGGDSSMDEVIP